MAPLFLGLVAETLGSGAALAVLAAVSLVVLLVALRVARTRPRWKRWYSERMTTNEADPQLAAGRA